MRVLKNLQVKKSPFRESFDIVTARAVARLSVFERILFTID